MIAAIGLFFARQTLTTWLLVGGIAAFGIWFGYEKLKSYNAGKQAVITRINKETEKKENEWKSIDSTDSTVDDAVRRLRNRANGR